VAWSFGGQNFDTSPRDALRVLIDDINQATPLIQDEVLDYLLGQNRSLYGAAAAACDILATRFAGDVDTSIGKVSVSYARRSQAYSERAAAFRRRAQATAGGFILSGGQSRTQKAAAASNPDAVQPAFKVGMDDYGDEVYPPANYVQWIRGR
jgi:hypothetical protein